MEPIELATCFVSFKGSAVTILMKERHGERENHTLARRVMGYLRSEGFIKGNFSVMIGNPV